MGDERQEFQREDVKGMREMKRGELDGRQE
jgi:hypothetical protein